MSVKKKICVESNTSTNERNKNTISIFKTVRCYGYLLLRFIIALTRLQNASVFFFTASSTRTHTGELFSIARALVFLFCFVFPIFRVRWRIISCWSRDEVDYSELKRRKVKSASFLQCGYCEIQRNKFG